MRAITQDPSLPESYYHLARYYDHYGNHELERTLLEAGEQAFDKAKIESVKRTEYHIDNEHRLAKLYCENREFFGAENELVRAASLYEDAVSRGIINRTPEFGSIYADLGDIEYFTKSGDMNAALRYYNKAESNGYCPPPVNYRMAVAQYRLGNLEDAQRRFFDVSMNMLDNSKLLFALGNVSFLRGDYRAAQGYYEKLVAVLHPQTANLSTMTGSTNLEDRDVIARLMMARNNLGADYQMLANQTGEANYNAESLALYAESSGAWEALTRDPVTMQRPGAGSLATPGVNLGFLNTRNSLRPLSDARPQIFNQIDRDVLDPSPWETLMEGR
jgi:tetratricopeptide (TPR) repeat protein